MRSVFVDGREWFDRVNGNSYFSARVYVDGVEALRIPFQYGYGSAYEYAAADALADAGFIPSDPHAALWRRVEDMGGDGYATLRRVTKRECEAWGRPWDHAVIVPGRYSRPMTEAELATLA